MKNCVKVRLISLFMYFFLLFPISSVFTEIKYELKGKVLSPRGDPLSGAIVRINLLNEYTIKTDNNGMFLWTDVKVPAFVVDAKHPDYSDCKAMVIVDPMQKEKFVLLVLNKIIELDGRISNANKEGIPKARVYLECYVGGYSSSGFGKYYQTETNEEGKYILRGLVPNHPYGLAVYAEGYVRVVTEPFIVFSEFGPNYIIRDKLSIKMEKGNKVTFQVFGPDGKPVPDAYVTVNGNNWHIASGKTDINGEVVLSDLPLGQVHIVVNTKQQYKQKEYLYKLNKDEIVKIMLEESKNE